MHHAKDSAGVVRRKSKRQRHGEKEIKVFKATIHQNFNEQANPQAPKVKKGDRFVPTHQPERASVRFVQVPRLTGG
jgi:hypothetical protein